MIRGIAIMGLNGCGKSTLAHAISKKLNYYEIDVEDYYFPEQKYSRQAILEQKYDVTFILEVPADERVKRVQQREEIRFGSRVMPGGDMYEQQKEFREIIANKSSQSVEESAKKMQCRKVRLDGTKSIDQNVSVIMSVLL